MIYLDSNVFIHAALYADERGERARTLLGQVTDGKDSAATAALTFDEVFWIVKNVKGLDSALLAGEAFLAMPNLLILKVDSNILWDCFTLIKKYKLDPRDAIHAACAIRHGIYTIISEDKDFDGIPELERRWL